MSQQKLYTSSLGHESGPALLQVLLRSDSVKIILPTVSKFQGLQIAESMLLNLILSAVPSVL